MLDVSLYIDQDVTNNFALKHYCDHLSRPINGKGDGGLQVVDRMPDDDDETNEQVADRKVIEYDSEI